MYEVIQPVITIALILGLAFLILEIRRYRGLVEKIKDATPWLGWIEYDEENDEFYERTLANY